MRRLVHRGHRKLFGRPQIAKVAPPSGRISRIRRRYIRGRLLAIRTSIDKVSHEKFLKKKSAADLMMKLDVQFGDFVL